jgi:hypothetical protein
VTETAWEPSRLIPVSGINGADEQERRGVSALMAVLESVREFGRAITAPLGAPVGSVSTFIEVTFKIGDKSVRPDGVIRVTRGAKSWTTLVEVKTGRNDLVQEQVEAYLDVAREQGFDAVLTISNQLVAMPGQHPLAVDKRKTRKVALHHLSWSEIHTEAVVERVNRSVSDPDQAWILSELIRYLEHPRSGAVDFDDMGPAWVSIREAASQRSLRINDKNVADVVSRFGQLVSFAGMRLGRDLGVEVRPVLSRADLLDPPKWLQGHVQHFVESGTLRGTLRVPNTIGPIIVGADLVAGRVSCSTTVDAPSDGRATTRINWLVRQLSGARDDVLVEATSARSRKPGAGVTLGALREDPKILIDDPLREIKSFTITMGTVAGTKRGQGRGSFVSSVLELCDLFYVDIIQNIKPWSPSAPKVKSVQDVEDLPSGGEIVGELPIKADPLRHPKPIDDGPTSVEPEETHEPPASLASDQSWDGP